MATGYKLPLFDIDKHVASQLQKRRLTLKTLMANIHRNDRESKNTLYNNMKLHTLPTKS